MSSEIALHKMGGIEHSNIQRDSNIELFRIISMLLIVAHHYVVNSGLMLADGPIFADRFSCHSLFLLLFGMWGKIGINCFVMITGYFMCKSNITARKFAKLFFEIMFYRITISLIFWISGYETISLKSILNTIIPIRMISTGFTNAFILFYLLIPFLNILIKNVNERQHVYLLIWCGFTYVFLGSVPGFSVTMNYVSWFSVIYFIASYIRIYPKEIYDKKKTWLWLTIVFVLFDIISVLGTTWVGGRINKNIAHEFVSDSNTFLAVATGVCAFMLFKNLKINFNKIINVIATSTFGVLLIHANSDTMRQWLWNDILHVVDNYGSSYMPMYAIGTVLTIFCVCIFIDQIRICFIEKPFLKMWDRHWNGILKRYKKVESKIFTRIGI